MITIIIAITLVFVYVLYLADGIAFSVVMRRVPLSVDMMAEKSWTWLLPGSGFVLYRKWRARFCADIFKSVS